MHCSVFKDRCDLARGTPMPGRHASKATGDYSARLTACRGIRERSLDRGSAGLQPQESPLSDLEDLTGELGGRHVVAARLDRDAIDADRSLVDQAPGLAGAEPESVAKQGGQV